MIGYVCQHIRIGAITKNLDRTLQTHVHFLALGTEKHTLFNVPSIRPEEITAASTTRETILIWYQSHPVDEELNIGTIILSQEGELRL